MTALIKTMEIQYVLNGIHENPQTRITKKRSQQQTTRPSGWCSRWGILIQSCWNVHKSQAKTAVRGPPGSTIIIFKEIKRFNNNNNNNHLTHGPPRFLPTRGSSRRGVLPPLRGGNSIAKSFLFSPYPAIPPYVVRTPHPGITDDPENSTCLSCTQMMHSAQRDAP